MFETKLYKSVGKQLAMKVVEPNGTFKMSVALGLVEGWGCVQKFGANSEILSGSTEIVSEVGGTYASAASAVITHISQVADVAADRGAVINIQGVDNNFNLVVQEKALDASDSSTLVALDTPLRRVFRLKVNDSMVLSETLQATDAAGTTQYGIVTSGNNQSLIGAYTIPAGKTGLLDKVWADVIPEGSKTPLSVEFQYWFQDNSNGYAPQLKHARGVPENGDGIDYTFGIPMEIPEKTDIFITAKANGQDAHVHAGFDLYLIDN